jgi:hypothetical protein
MPRIEIPLAYRKLKTTGDKVLRAELDLELKTIANAWEPARFVFDSGTEMTTMPAADARRMDLPMPRRPARGLTFRGQEARAGLLRARIVGTETGTGTETGGDRNRDAARTETGTQLGDRNRDVDRNRDAASGPKPGRS